MTYQIKRIIPNTLTSCNLLCGALSVYMATQGVFQYAFLLILCGAVFDFFDGFAARLLKAPSPIGVELDSLADDITFGLAPAMMLTCYLKPLLGWWSLLALIMAAFSAIRLARFNLDERQHYGFIGLSTPANAIFWGSLCSMPYAITAPAWMPWLMIGFSFVSCYLMNCNLPMISNKFQNYTWKDNKDKFLFFIGALVLLLFCVIECVRFSNWQLIYFAGAAIIVWYVLLNILLAILNK